MNLIYIIMVFGIVLGIFLGLLLLSLTRKNKTANRFLGLIMIVSSVCVSGFGLTKTGLYMEMPHLIGIASTMIFLLGPLFYFYIKAFSEQNFTLSKKNYLHFTPFLILVLYLIPFYFQNSETKLAVFHSSAFSIEHKFIIFIQILHSLIYIFFIKKHIKKFPGRNKSTTSSSDKINLGWINIVANVFMFIMVTIALFLGLLFSGLKIHPLYSAFIPVAISFAVVSLGFIGLKLPIIFPSEKELSQIKKYEKSTLTNEQANEYLEKLFTLMQNEKPFLKSDLTLQKLSECLSISPHHLSQIINEKLNQNFFDFINSFRIEEAKHLLTGSRGELFTILAISEEVGFNSKSSFNTAFKKYTGLTPTQYKEMTLQHK